VKRRNPSLKHTHPLSFVPQDNIKQRLNHYGKQPLVIDALDESAKKRCDALEVIQLEAIGSPRFIYRERQNARHSTRYQGLRNDSPVPIRLHLNF